MKKSPFRKLSLTLIALAITAGCAKDRTTDDAQQELLQQQQAKIAEVARGEKGAYRGTLTVNGMPVAAVTMTVRPGTTVVSGSSSAILQQAATLQGRVTLDDGTGNVRILNFDNGSYYQKTRHFTVSVPVSASGSSSGSQGSGGSSNLSVSSGSKVEITGDFGDGTVAGEIVADNDEDRKGSFSLVADGTLPTGQALKGGKAARIAEGDILVSTYAGTAQFTTGEDSEPVTLVLLNHQSNDANLDFYEYFVSVKTVDVQINLGSNGASVIIPGAQLDLRRGRLSGHAGTGSSANITGSSSYYDVAINCLRPKEAARKMGWDCNYYAGSNGNGQARFSASFNPAQPSQE